jgi:endonuclease/exonuclease/phosphatase family metal-dependent hydrolase
MIPSVLRFEIGWLNRALVPAVTLALVGPMGYWTGAHPGVPRSLRVLTYNIHHGEGMDGEFDLPRQAAVIASTAPDLVALQEVDQGTARAGGVNQLTELGRLLGMHAVFGKTMDFQGGEYGVGVLSRTPIVRADHHLLPGPSDREPRIALTVYVAIGEHGPLLQFTSTHLDPGRDPVHRMAQATYLNELLAGEAHGPSILAGDMNCRAEIDVMQILGERWTDVVMDREATGLGRVQRRLDYVIARPPGRWRTIDSKVVDATMASDHRPVLAVLEWVENP